MPPYSIVENLNVLKDTCPGFLNRPVVLCIDQFDLQAGEERLHHRIVPAIALAAHATPHPMRFDSFLVLIAPVLQRD